MECITGEDLLKTFQVLDINLANIGPEVIKAWFDSDCPDTIEFLNWLCQLSRKNVISVHEVDQYEKIVERKKVLEGEEFENALEDIDRAYPGIFDVEEQVMELEHLKEEVTALLKEEKEQESVITAQKQAHEKLCKCLMSATNEHAVLNVSMRRAEEECLLLSQQLDDTNTQLHLHLIKCSEKLSTYENIADPIYVSLIPMDEYNIHYQNILSDIDLLIKSDRNALPKLETAKKSCRKLNETIFNFDYVTSSLSILKNRMFHSIQNKNYKQATEQRLLAELKYLKNLKLFDIINYTMDTSYRLQVEDNILLKNVCIDRKRLELENVAKQASENLANSLKLHFTQSETQMAFSKFQNLSGVNTNVSKILSYQLLLYFMHVSNNKDLVEAETFFRTVYHYVTNDLSECVLRTEAMQKKINSCNENANVMLYEQHSLMKALLIILSEYQEENSELTGYELMSKFKSEKNNLEIKLFLNDFEKYRESSKKFERDVKLLKSFLASGPTAECIIMPYDLYKLFEEAKNAIEALKTSLSSTLKITSDDFKKGTENKWLKMKRRLWMYFLFEPQKVSSFISEIKTEVNAVRAQML